MTPNCAALLQRALSSCPSQTRTNFVGVNYPTYKIERIATSYRKIISAYDRLSRSLDVARVYPRLAVAFRLASSRLPRLDYNVIIVQALTDRWFKEVQDKERLERFAGFCFDKQEETPFNPVYDRAAKRARSYRKEELSFRIQEELTGADVYPVFWTLTCDPRHEGIIAKGRQEFKNWLRNVRSRFGDFKYCCVVERGAEGRLHYHSLFLFADLSRCSCPNYNRPGGNRQEIPELRGFWPYGLSSPVAVRYSPRDVYGRIGWRWPRGQKTGSPVAVALYMAKYLTKPTHEVNGCRSKMTRGFGLFNLAQMTDREAVEILHNSPEAFINRMPFRSAPPPSSLKRFAAKKLFGNLPRLPLPPTRVGSVAQAAQMLVTEEFTLTNAGDSVNRGVGFNGCLDPYRVTTLSVSIGKII